MHFRRDGIKKRYVNRKVYMKLILLGILLLLTFFYGIVIGTAKIFPYEYVKYGIFMLIENNYSNEQSSNYRNQKSQFDILSHKPAKIMMLGDSIIESGHWNELLQRSDIINRGLSGDTTIGIIHRLDNINPGIEKTLIMIGINDISRGKEADEIFTSYRQMLSILKKKNITPIIHSTLYVGANNPWFYNTKVTELNRLLAEYAMHHNILYIDINKVLAPEGFLDDRYSEDGLHLNGDGYRQWARVIEQSL